MSYLAPDSGNRRPPRNNVFGTNPHNTHCMPQSAGPPSFMYTQHGPGGPSPSSLAYQHPNPHPNNMPPYMRDPMRHNPMGHNPMGPGYRDRGYPF